MLRAHHTLGSMGAIARVQKMIVEREPVVLDAIGGVRGKRVTPHPYLREAQENRREVVLHRQPCGQDSECGARLH